MVLANMLQLTSIVWSEPTGPRPLGIATSPRVHAVQMDDAGGQNG